VIATRHPVLHEVKRRIAGRSIEGAVGLAHHSKWVRKWALDRLTERLKASYVATTPNDETLRLYRWFGASLRPFIERLIAERPRAAKAIGRFLVAWSADIHRRNAGRKAGRCAPTTVVIEATDRCNLNCPGCYAKSTRKGGDLSYELLQALVSQCADMGATLITISGGEPFLREREDRALTRLGRAFPDLGFLVYTNGTLIDEDTAHRLYEAGNIFPAISVEGRKVETDARRGEGCYDKTRTVRELLAEYEVMHGFSATVTRRNAELIASDEFIDQRIAEGDMFGWFFIYQPIGRRPDPELMVTADQRAALRDKIYAWRDAGKPIFLGDFWNDGLLAEGCMAAGTRYFHVYANGDISPCVFAPVACGNVRDILSGDSEYASVGDLISRHPFFVAFREKQRQITDWRAPCVLIDHPEMFREVCACHPYFAGKNMPEGYLQGDIADTITRRAEEWQAKLAHLPRVPACCHLPPAEEGARQEEAAQVH